MPDTPSNLEQDGDCVSPPQALPPEQLARYGVERDVHLERDIANYVEIQTRDEEVQHVERVKQEIVLGDAYEVWDVITDQDRWWVITNLTNLYSQRHFPSLDFTLSFHIGLMMRLRSRPDRAAADAPTPFDEVFRRQDQAHARHEAAIEAEDYQAVGMQLRECLLALLAAIRRRIEIPPTTVRPQDANFVDWCNVLVNQLCRGASNKDLRHHLKATAKSTWQLVNWLTHSSSANKTASSISVHACDTVVGHFIQILEREKADRTDHCPRCRSRDVRSHFDISIGTDGDYYMSCGICDWTNHPALAEQ